MTRLGMTNLIFLSIIHCKLTNQRSIISEVWFDLINSTIDTVNTNIAIIKLNSINQHIKLVSSVSEMSELPEISKLNLEIGKDLIEEAIEAYDNAIRINPNDYELYCYKGNALREQGKYDEAKSKDVYKS